jgi:hypothetical protein
MRWKMKLGESLDVWIVSLRIALEYGLYGTLGNKTSVALRGMLYSTLLKPLLSTFHDEALHELR